MRFYIKSHAYRVGIAAAADLSYHSAHYGRDSDILRHAHYRTDNVPEVGYADSCPCKPSFRIAVMAAVNMRWYNPWTRRSNGVMRDELVQGVGVATARATVIV